MEIEWIRSHQKRTADETYEQRANRLGNDAADKGAVEMRKSVEYPRELSIRVKELRGYALEYSKANLSS